ncbi:hypothetical protein HRJ35_07835 [Shewanella oneidensis MR-1]|nr:hypothetical protein [Shewanella oneidensis]MDX5997004.1 hypothetical protein [Shewanella oneidensis]MEE2028143.1 hypothetical protein [Shewanella oneidensis]QKG95932.1 hypothetical protein HRJ35_07835 [Shewanella oneidensis MR-1]
MTESKSKGLPDEPFGQHLAAKTTLKRQHALVIAPNNSKINETLPSKAI